MMQSFKYIPIVVSQNPMDFNYKFGFNDNSPDKFCYTDTLANIGSIFTQQSQLFKSNATNDLISFNEILKNDDMISNFTIIESPYQVKNYFTNNIKRLDLMKFNDIKAMNTQIAINATNQTFNLFMNGINSAINNKPSTSSQAMDLANSILSLINNITSLVQTIQTLKTKETKLTANIKDQIALLNESIESSREFREQMQTELDRRRRKK